MEHLRLEHALSHGVCSVRHVNGVCLLPQHADNVHNVLVPLGPTVQWVRICGSLDDETRLQRVGRPFPLHRDAITCITRIYSSNNAHYVLSASYTGQLRLTRICLGEFDFSVDILWEAYETRDIPVMHLSAVQVSPEDAWVAACSFRRDRNALVPLSKTETHAALSVFRVIFSTDTNEPMALQLLRREESAAETISQWIVQPGCAPLLFSGINDLDVRHTAAPSSLALKELDSVKRASQLHVSLGLSPITCVSAVSETNGAQTVIIVVQSNRSCHVFVHQNLEMQPRLVLQTKLEGLGPIFSVTVSRQQNGLAMYVCEDGGEVSIWVLELSPPCSLTKVSRVKFSQDTSPSNSVDVLSESLLLVCSSSGLHLCTMNDPERAMDSILWHELACCGAAFGSAGGKSFGIVGDLSGNAMVWPADRSASGAPLLRLQHGSPVRCVCAANLDQAENSMLVFCGLMDGSIHQWVLRLDGSLGVIRTIERRELISPSASTITAIVFHPSGTIFAVSDSLGRVMLFDRVPGEPNHFKILRHIAFETAQADHVTSKEIWNLSWNEQGDALATANEDSTVSVLRFDRVNGVLSPWLGLSGPRAAVTSVRWSQDRIFASSDDCTIHSWRVNPSTEAAQLECIYKTDERHLMITYLETLQASLTDHERIWVLATTMAGFIYLFHRGKPAHVDRVKAAIGSLEGLAVTRMHESGWRILTCSSDCSVHVHTFGW